VALVCRAMASCSAILRGCNRASRICCTEFVATGAACGHGQARMQWCVVSTLVCREALQHTRSGTAYADAGRHRHPRRGTATHLGRGCGSAGICSLIRRC
jgi:hypothetical protein